MRLIVPASLSYKRDGDGDDAFGGFSTLFEANRGSVATDGPIPDIRAGRVEFTTKEEFYSYWRAYEGWNTSAR